MNKNNDRYFGLHFDFHADEDSVNIGENSTEEQIQKIIDMIHPDFLQCDCKGHPGISSYPTKIGNKAKGIRKDILKMWRDVTKRNGVCLFVHYSGIWDRNAIKENPSWAVVRADGSKSEYSTSLFSNYEDQILIPQLMEIAGEYGVDGVWIDGDCWGIERDYGEKAVNEFVKETGIKEIPKSEKDKYFKEFNEFFREKYRMYLKKYVDTLHEKYPDFKVISNWAFTTYMPERIFADVDYLSGDVWGIDNVNKARFEARFMSQQNKTWDLMSWGVSLISKNDGDQTGSTDFCCSKPAIQLMQEAAIILSQGGGFQIYYNQNRDGSVYTEQLLPAQKVGDFCRERKQYCYNTKSGSEIAILNSGYAGNRLNKSLYAFWNGDLDWIKGIMQCMLDSQLSVDVAAEFHELSKYKVIVIPEWEELNNTEFLKKYVFEGGSLIVIGKSVKLFDKELGVIIKEKNNKCTVYLTKTGMCYTVGGKNDTFIVENNGAEVLEYMSLNSRNFDGDKYIAATINNYGKGKIAGVYFDFGASYLRGRTIGICDFIKKIVNKVLDEPFVSVTGTRYVENVVRKKDNKLLINLINLASPHSNCEVFDFDEIPRIGPVTVKVKALKKPKSVILMPDNIPLEYTYENNTLSVVVQLIKIYDIVVIENE